MSDNVIFVRQYSKGDERLSHINFNEVYRYAGLMGIKSGYDEAMQNECMEAISDVLSFLEYKVAYRRMQIDSKNSELILPFGNESKDLQKCLGSSSEIIIFAATIGLGIDRQIAKNKRAAMTKALFMQAFGAERVESLCDVFCNEIKDEVSKEGLVTTPRFSPGYGDLSLEVQKDIFSLLDCNRKVGISLGESLLMTPSKSVTAIFGLGSK